MRRLGILVFYDNEGIVDSYIDYLLKELDIVCEKVYLIVNGVIQQYDLNRLRTYITDIYIRDNSGFDAGAYKDAFLNLIPYYNWIYYDEIVLVNDTFFGPIFSLKNLWEKVGDENIDFWGLTRHPRVILSDGKEINSHIQSYFLVIRKRMSTSSCFLNFWKNLSYLMNYQDVIDNFELKFTVFFEAAGFRGKALMDDVNFQYEDNPYIYHSYELLKAGKLPFIKKKCLGFQRAGYENTLDAIEYIKREYQYDLEMIWKNICRLCKEKRYDSILDYYKLELFYNRYKRIYIYGAGKYGRKMQKYFYCRGWIFEKILVSDNRNISIDSECCNYRDVFLDEMDGVVLALGEKATEEVLQMMIKDLKPEQIFTLQFDRG